VVLIFAQRKSGWLVKAGLLFMMTLTFLLAGYISGERLMQRFKENSNDQLNGRAEIYKTAEKMAADFPLFGTGPNTFGSVIRLYLNPRQLWFVQAHNDWLETRVTFGWVGLLSLVLVLICVAARSFFSGGIYAHWSWAAFFWIALGGCLVHARFDFPLQIYSILFVFIIECAMLFSFTYKK
jgi:O-antigen ligase